LGPRVYKATVATPPSEPTPDLTTERVRSGRWKALVVLTVASVIVGALLWKPWDQLSPVPTSPPVVGAIPTPVHTSPATTLPAPIAGVGPTPLIEHPPPPTTGAPQEDASTYDAPDDLGSVTLDAGGGVYVRCYYNTAQAPQLAQVEVFGPVITTAAGAAGSRLSAVSWTAVLESNRESKFFEADWQQLDKSATRTVSVSGPGDVWFKNARINVDAHQLPPDALLRVTELVSWTGAHGRRLAQQSLVAREYGLGAEPYRVTTDGCPATEAG